MTASASLSVQVPVLETQRLILREPRLADFDAYADFAASPRAGFVGGPMDRMQAWSRFAASTGHWILRGFGLWTIEDKATGAVAGRAGLIAHEGWPETELGWQIHDGFEGRGYAHEAAMAARSHACHVMGLPPMISLIAPANTRSRRLAERMGAVIERESELLGQPCLIYRHPAEAA
ncbi:GNAT family N-acetyltransferase [Paracoccus lutimaris]|uniref:RimJ/RimL family protein N-acetyltransferase n=1 Tax=Paracoccus lutimaris TaxID=1490030 RepID=A0A368YID8_9RHOB|nr:GNAT family N-acetyltransferase [Paracoccus lutimaris]RCW80001.1 RimJ/RimL family protein N-acetyltransferase [Paracoccus lutimaris]